jgi:hypothetical protein
MARSVFIEQRASLTLQRNGSNHCEDLREAP